MGIHIVVRMAEGRADSSENEGSSPRGVDDTDFGEDTKSSRSQGG